MRTRALAGSVALPLGMLFGVWCLSAGRMSDDMRPVPDQEAARISGGLCLAISPSPDCDGSNTKNGMPESCPGATYYDFVGGCNGNVSSLKGTSCQTPCSTNCGQKTVSYKDCNGEPHNF